MINTDMRTYNYFTFEEDNGYGAPSLSSTVSGSVKMSINTTSQATQDNILFKDASYIGLTHSGEINDKFVIQYGDEKLKVLYVQTKGRLKQVFMKNYD
ncbi:MAG: hypothetical protein ACI3T9_01415 [Romboutsia timonensis]